MDFKWNVIKTVSFRVEGRPVPWSVPRTFRHGGSKKNPKLVEWQAKVTEAARKAWGPFEASASPVRLTMVFGIQHDDIDRAGDIAVPDIRENVLLDTFTKRGGPRADLTNLGKGTEDGLEGIIVVNDVLVVAKQEVAVWAMLPFAEIYVELLDGRMPTRD